MEQQPQPHPLAAGDFGGLSGTTPAASLAANELRRYSIEAVESIPLPWAYKVMLAAAGCVHQAWALKAALLDCQDVLGIKKVLIRYRYRYW